ncbi:MAG: MopE-related protein [Bacteroidia bacterium]
MLISTLPFEKLKRDFSHPVSSVKIKAFVALLLLFSGSLSAQTTQTFNSTGTWLAPAGVTAVKVECWGGGGKGGTTSFNGAETGGGGGGAYARKNAQSVTPGTSYTVTVGAGATGTSAGGDSWFSTNSTVLAKGGNSVANNGTSGASGGSSASSIGDVKFGGGNGANGSNTNYGGGGGSSAGTAANGVNATNQNGATAPAGGGNGGNGRSVSNGDGLPGVAPGGGGGGVRTGTFGSQDGGDGASGRVLLTWTCPTYSLTATNIASSICAGSAATINLTGNAANLPVGTYTVTYNLSGANTGTGLTASITVSTAGSVSFNTGNLNNGGSTTITITNLSSGAAGGVCSSNLSSNNTAVISVISVNAGSITGAQTLCSSGDPSLISNASLGSGSGTITYLWQSSTTSASAGFSTIPGEVADSYDPPAGISTTTWFRRVTVSDDGTNVCQANSAAVEVSVMTVNAGAISGNQNVCGSSTPTTLGNTTAGSVTFTGSGSPVRTYRWEVSTTSSSTGFTTVGGATANTYSPSSISTTTWYRRVTIYTLNSVSCEAISNVVQLTYISFTSSISPAGSQAICSPVTSLLLTASTNAASPAFQWKLNGSNIAGATNGTYTATATGSYTVVVTASGCTLESAATIATFSSGPTLSASASQSNVCIGSTVNLNATGTSNTLLTFSQTNNTSVSIPDNSATGASSSITVSGLPNLGPGVTVRVDNLNITHTYNADLEIYLARPGGGYTAGANTEMISTIPGQSIRLSNDNGGSANGYSNCSFRDNAATSITSQSGNVVITGTYIPEELFSTLTGDPNGAWTLRVIDDANADVGSLTSWTLVITYPSGLSYSWTSTPSGFTSNLEDPTGVSLNQNTDFTVVATDNATGCTSSATVSVNAISLPSPKIIPGDTVLCSNTDYWLHVVDTGAYSGGYPVGTTLEWLNIVAGQSPNDSINANGNGSSYQAVITLPSGCSATSPVRTVFSKAIIPNEVITHATCNLSNGKIVANVVIGTAPFHFVWKENGTVIRDTISGNTADSIYNMAAGTYTLDITDNYGNVVLSEPSCVSQTNAYTINQVAPPAVSVTGTNITCYGVNDGTVTASPSMGSTPYSYLWSNGGSLQTLTYLAPGTYTVTVTDADGCTSEGQTTIVEPGQLVSNLAYSEPLCTGQSNANIHETPGGGTPPFSFEWYDPTLNVTGTNDDSLVNVAAGLYSIVLTDGNNCSVIDQILVEDPPLLTSSASSIGVTCNGGADGTLDVTSMGGRGIHTYLWSNGSTAASQTGIVAGTYTVTVTDINGCTSVSSVTVSEPAAVSGTATGADVNCIDGTTTVTVVASGGTAPYTGEGTFTVGIGSYTYPLTDANGCTGSASITINSLDNQAPLISDCPANITQCGDIVTWTPPTASDNCTLISLTGDYTPGSSFSVGTTTVTYTATDNAGLSSTCSFTVTILPTPVWYADADGDQFGNAGVSVSSCTQPIGYVADNTDCDDAQILYADIDGDSFGAGLPAACGVSSNTDCDDNNAAVNPSATEVCNSIDDDCDGSVDEGLLLTFYADADGDLYGDAASTILACSAPAGYVTDNTDCNDAVASINPAAAEVCNGIDDNCDGSVDNGLTFADYYADADADGFGGAFLGNHCAQPVGAVTNNADCDDNNNAVNPAATEVCNGIDDNCDGAVDNGLTFADYYADADADGFGGAFVGNLCAQPVGAVLVSGDCDDNNAAVNPAAIEVCNSIDDDCDGSVDEGVLLTFYADADGDGFGDAASTTLACSAPAGYVADNTDCDDTQILYSDADGDSYGAGSPVACGVASNSDCDDNNAAVNPSATEVCNAIDDNCDGLNDNGLSFADYYADADGDLFGGAFLGNLCAQPSGSVLVSGDCDDNNAAVNPSAVEVCNSIDDDCDGSIDEGILLTFYADADGDLYGDAAVSTLACSAPVGYVADNTDCNDAVASINPAAAEVCNGIDDNCDGLNDNGLSFADYYADADGDLFGGAFLGNLCAQPSGSVLVSGDCDDNNAAVNPSAVEVCNSIDDDCDGSIDEGVLLTFYADADGDLYGDAAVSTLACSAPVGYVADNTDCNDAVASINPAAAEVCNGIDDNCDGLNDNGLTFADYYADADGDLFGGAFLGNLCAQPSGSVLVSGDCDDNNAAVNPSAVEVCNSIDDDCDGSIDEGVLLTFYADADGDLYGDAAVSTLACSAPVGYVADNTDCNDAVASINPAAAEVCNGIDDNCDGSNDNGLSFADYYADADGDLFGGAFLGNLCAQPSGSVLVSGDCDDNNAAVNPSAVEVCNSIDDDCDGSIDEGVLLTFYADVDGDGFGDAAVSTLACSAPVGYVADNTDCDDTQLLYADADGDTYGAGAPVACGVALNTDCNDNSNTVYPGASEICGNGIDEDCDGIVDNGCPLHTYFEDEDGDSYGNPNEFIVITAPTAPFGYVSNNLDCDDDNAAINPSATEVCNSIDDDCDGSVDEGVLLTFYADADGDSYGDAAVTTLACSAPVGYVADNTDCNDAVAAINPAAAEVCNGIDDNCDGSVDNGLTFADYYADADGDGFGGAFLGNLCAQPSGSVLVSGDCDDNNAAVNPSATEVCNSIDDDCDGSIDEGVLLTFYADADGDLYGDAAVTTLACSAPVGYVADNTDCNDAVAAINPAAAEVCNGIDDNCDGSVDNGLTFADYYADADGDGFGGAFLGNLCAQPSGSVLVSGDCDDNNAAVNPSATEVCNSIDDDCDGSIDEGVLLTFYADADGDLFGDAAATVQACSAPVGYVADNTDCNDAVASINPAAAEVCNGIDDNCDGSVDNGLTFADYYADADGDGFGGAFLGNLCAQPSGSVLVSGDCDDNNAAVNPSATEVCNSIDDDCDGSIDEGVLLTFYADADGDLYGDAAVTTLACSAPVGYVADNTDCNDAVAAINPAAAEVCNGIDDNCDGSVDNGLTFADYYADADGDGFGGAFLGNLCAQPSGSVLVSGDCDDNNAAVNPSATEVCNSIDDDCDGSIDEGVLLTFYADADGDLFGDAAATVQACSAPVGYVADNTDCNDAVASINPAAAEVCNGIDDNCDGSVDNGLTFADYYADADGDGFGGAFLGNLCAQPSGSVLVSGDCDDNNAAVNPSATEVCNSIDDDCDGSVDEGVLLTFYADADGDLYGDAAVTTLACSAPVGYVADNTDCNDAVAAINPAAAEVCNGIDDNCDGSVDNGLTFADYYADADGDGFGGAFLGNLCAQPSGSVLVSGDCDDNNAAVNPSATEVCNSIDDDCDGSVDEGVLLTFYADADGDSYGDAAVTTLACSAPVGYVADNTDCNDAVAAINPAAAEVCNGIDDNCDGSVDNGLTFADYYADADADGFGGAFLGNLCAQPSGSVLVSGDCDDNNAAVNPSATEVCNSIDDDCDGSIDEGVLLTFYADADGDLFGDAAATVQACSAPVGYVADNTDCNDAVASINPAAAEVCNGIDDNCDGSVDNGLTFADYYADADGDGFGGAFLGNLCAQPSGSVLVSGDCDDNNAAVNPSATEVCNSIDDDCDGSVDEGVLLTFYADADGDSYGDAAVTTLACSAPVGYVADNTDCNDAVAAINPAAAEVCNGIDDNCDGSVDNGLTFADYYADADGDGFGGAFLGNLCAQPSGSVLVSGDCDDNNAAVNPSATEVCNSIDDDCDGSIDEGVLLTFYADADGDLFGDAAATVQACSAPVGYVADNTDCNDAVASINPAAAEVCNGIDDNCDGSVDNGLTFADYYADADGDGFGGAFLGNLCAQPSGSVLVSGDCDDNNAAVNPSATEVCNSIDDDCDGSVDEGVLLTFYADADGDLYGDAAVTTLACSAPVGYVADNTDCNDAVAAINPAAAEVCNGIDDNCDGSVDNGLTFADYYADADGDGFGGAFLGNLCAQPSGSVLVSGDCDDNNAAVNPSATEVCNSIDDDCDGSVDEGVLLTFYADADGDSYGDAAVTTLACSAPVGYVADNTDCNDAVAAINPAAAEVCNGIDDNCDGSVDNGLTFADYYADADADGFGGAFLGNLCAQPSGSVLVSGDCDDNNAAVNPSATEVCNSIDDDCDGSVDEGVLLTFYADADGDSYGDAAVTTLACSAPVGYVADNTDCNDAVAAINPAAAEVCNGIDDNCDGSVDNGLTFADYYADADADGFGGAFLGNLCAQPSGSVLVSGDCDDNNAAVNPSATEVCNSIDDDCDGSVDEGVLLTFYADADGDGFGSAFSSVLACSAPAGYVVDNTDCDDNLITYTDNDGDFYGTGVPVSCGAANNLDCDDNNAAVNPAATEICNSIDDDCDGSVDEGVLLPFYADTDGDGYGVTGSSVQACSAPIGYVAVDGDCDDNSNAVHPGATEYCNGIDDDCDGVTDDNVIVPVGAISGPAQQCVPATFNFATYSIAAPAGANFYNWTVPVGMTIYAGQGTNSVLVTWTGQSVHNGISGPMTVTVGTVCGGIGTSSVEIDINYTSPVQPPSISGPGKVCPGDVVIYSVASVARAKSYTWTIPAGMNIVSGQGTNIINVSVSGSFIGGSVSVNASNFCGSGPARAKTIGMNTALAPAVITGQSTGLCGASNIILSTAGSANASSYTWSVPSGVTIQSGQGSASVNLSISGSFTTGAVTVTAQNGCGAGATRTLSIIGAPGQPSIISGPTAICSGTANVAYEINTVAGASSYQWVVPSAIGTIASGQGTKQISVNFNVTTATNQVISVKASNACGTGATRSLSGISVGPGNCGTPREAISGISKVEVFPNPATTTVNIRFESETEQSFTLSLIDLSGRVIYTTGGQTQEGMNQQEINLDQLSSGMYYVSLNSETFHQQIRLMVE